VLSESGDGVSVDRFRRETQTVANRSICAWPPFLPVVTDPDCD